MFEQVEQSRLGPMDVLDDEGKRSLSGASLERFPDRPEDVLRRNRRERLRELVLGTPFAEYLDQRPVRDALSVGKTAAGEHARAAREQGGQLAGKPRLPDPRRAEDGDEFALALRDRPVEGGVHQRQLLTTTDEWCVEPPLVGGCAFEDLHEAKGLDELGFPLERKRLDEVDLDRPPRETARLLADQDLARLRSLLEPRGNVDRISCRKPLLRAGDDLSCVDTGANLQRDPVVAFELVIERAERVAELGCGTYGTEGIVLVHRRYPEDGHDCVADELLDRFAMALEASSRRLEVARHHPAQRLGVELLAECRRAGHVREQDRHRLADLPRGGHTKLSAAAATEACAVGVRLAAARARSHRQSVCRAAERSSPSRDPIAVHGDWRAHSCTVPSAIRRRVSREANGQQTFEIGAAQPCGLGLREPRKAP